VTAEKGPKGEKIMQAKNEGSPLSSISKATVFHALAGGMYRHGLVCLAKKAKQAEKRKTSMIRRQVLSDKHQMHAGSGKKKGKEEQCR
jgi:hypothetical protein